MDRAAAGHDRGSHLRAERRAGLRRLPRRRAAVRRAGAEPALRRRRRQHRLSDARACCRSAAPATARCRSPDGTRRTTGRASSRSRSCPSSLQPAPRATSSPPTTRSSATDYPLLPHARLGLRLARRAHRRSARSARSRWDRSPPTTCATSRPTTSSAMGKRLAAAYMDVSTGDAGAGCRARPAAGVGCAERRGLGCRRLRERAVGRARAEPLRARPRARGAGHRPGPPVPRRGRTARRPGLAVVDQRRSSASPGRPRCSHVPRASAYDRLVDAAGRQPGEVELGRAARAAAGQRHVRDRRASRPIESLFNRGPYPVGGGASVVDATGWDDRRGLRDRPPCRRCA